MMAACTVLADGKMNTESTASIRTTMIQYLPRTDTRVELNGDIERPVHWIQTALTFSWSQNITTETRSLC